jgi:hypothetical protein
MRTDAISLTGVIDLDRYSDIERLLRVTQRHRDIWNVNVRVNLSVFAPVSFVNSTSSSMTMAYFVALVD